MGGDLPVRVRAPAKINVTLRVLGVRADGYHELRTVFQSLALHDRLTFEATGGAFEIVCDDPACPTGETNLVWRAARQVWRAAGRRGCPSGVRVEIEKGIPVQSGLGGGSSDAAAALRVLAAAWCPAMTRERLEAMGAALGADVPFFFRGGTVLGVERGDRLFQLADAPPSWVVLARPAFGVRTADAFGWFDRQAATIASRRLRRPAASGGPYGDGGNDLERPVSAHHPGIARLVARLRRHGASWAAMSGSGSVCFGLFESPKAAGAAAVALASPSCTTLVTRTLSARQYARWCAPMRAARPRR